MAVAGGGRVVAFKPGPGALERSSCTAGAPRDLVASRASSWPLPPGVCLADPSPGKEEGERHCPVPQRPARLELGPRLGAPGPRPPPFSALSEAALASSVKPSGVRPQCQATVQDPAPPLGCTETIL